MNHPLPAPQHIRWEGYAALYGASPAYSRKNSLAFVQAAGLSLRNPRLPSTVLIVEGNGDRIGERVDVAEDEFVRRLETDDSLWCKAWKSEDADLLCNLERFDEGWCEHYVIGHLQREAKDVVQRLVDRFIEETRGGDPELLIVDWDGAVEGFDWAEFWRGASTYSGPMPSVIGVPERLSSREHPEDRTRGALLIAPG